MKCSKTNALKFIEYIGTFFLFINKNANYEQLLKFNGSITLQNNWLN